MQIPYRYGELSRSYHSQPPNIPSAIEHKKINIFPIPNTKRQVKKFLGLCGFYRGLIPYFASVSDPFVALTSPKNPFKWINKENEAFGEL